MFATAWAGLPMRSGFHLWRWCKVVLLGCALGVLFAFINSQLWYFPSHRHVAPPFRLSDPSSGQELKRVVESQLSAFREGDFPGAYKYADSDLKAQMSLNAFERMVRTSFPVIARSQSVVFGVMVDNGEQAVVNTAIKGESGRMVHYQYMLRREPGRSPAESRPAAPRAPSSRG